MLFEGDVLLNEGGIDGGGKLASGLKPIFCLVGPGAQFEMQCSSRQIRKERLRRRILDDERVSHGDCVPQAACFKFPRHSHDSTIPRMHFPG